MPTMTLLPDAMIAESSGHWSSNTGGDRFDAVETNDGDTTYIEDDDNDDNVEFRIAQPSVTSADIGSITSVQLQTYGRYPPRGAGGSQVRYQFKNFPSDVAAEIITYPNSGSHQAVNGTVITTDSAGNAIDYTDIRDITLFWQKYLASSSAVRITYIAIVVTYVAAITDNAIFFGHNF